MREQAELLANNISNLVEWKSDNHRAAAVNVILAALNRLSKESQTQASDDTRKLSEALQRIASLGDSGSEDHWQEFDTGPGQAVVNGWRVAERMREIALDAVGNLRTTCAGLDFSGD